MSSDKNFNALQVALRADLAQCIQSNEVRHTEELKLTGGLPLYHYQEDGVKFIVSKHRCIVGDEMGLGKTLQALAAIREEDPDNKMRVLIICPKGAKPVWQMEIKKWLNEEAEIVDSRDKYLACGMKFAQPTKRFLICNFEQAREFYKFILQNPWHRIIIDEAHKIRNMSTKTFKNISKILLHFNFTPVTFITGTPLINTPSDLFSLLNLIDPEKFSNREVFLNTWFWCNTYGASKEYVHKDRTGDQFKKYMSSYMIRRMQKDTLELPEVIKLDTPIELEGDQKRIYVEVRDLWMATIGESEAILMANLLAQITRLKQICLSPGLIMHSGAESCDGAKTDELLDILEEFDGKTVIVSSFSSYLRALARKLRDLGYCVGIITGATNETDRANQVKDFQDDNGKIKIMLLSSKAGGESITLTKAGQFIHTDKPWTAAEEDQAFGRVFRIGQEKRVIRRSLFTLNTIEEWIEDIIDRKRNLAESSIPIATVRRLMFGGK